MQKVLGMKKTIQLRKWLKKGDFENVVHVLLEEYYDPRYQYAMSGYNYALELSTEDLSQAAVELITFRNQMSVRFCEQSANNV